MYLFFFFFQFSQAPRHLKILDSLTHMPWNPFKSQMFNVLIFIRDCIYKVIGDIHVIIVYRHLLEQQNTNVISLCYWIIYFWLQEAKLKLRLTLFISKGFDLTICCKQKLSNALMQLTQWEIDTSYRLICTNHTFPFKKKTHEIHMACVRVL